jgi:hypothetical protein
VYALKAVGTLYSGENVLTVLEPRTLLHPDLVAVVVLTDPLPWVMRIPVIEARHAMREVHTYRELLLARQGAPDPLRLESTVCLALVSCCEVLGDPVSNREFVTAIHV